MAFALPEGITTPSLVVDVDVLDANIERVAALAAAQNVALRPHAKTHKIPAVAERQRKAGAQGLTVATIGEAEVFAAAGFDDLFIAYPLWVDAGKAARLRALTERASVRVGVDSVESARRLAELVGPSVAVVIEVDSGHHRTGVAPADAARIARAAAESGLDVLGAFTFPGHSYDPDALPHAAADERAALSAAADALRDAGVNVRVLSGGSSPTIDTTTGGVLTEMRPGSYVFNDADQLVLGTCTPEQISLVAAATVVSVPAPDRFALDTGSKVLGGDGPVVGKSYGYLPDHPDAVVTSLSEHHAVVRLPEGVTGPTVGDVLAIVPGHVCPAVNLADELVVVSGGVEVDRWVVAARGANS